MIDVAGDREFDWIDDAFDDKRTAEDIARAKGTGLAGAALAVVLVVAAVLVGFTLLTLTGIKIG